MTAGTVLLLAALAVLVLVGARTGFGRSPWPAVLRPVVDTGTVFIVVGALLGPSGLNVFGAGLLAQLSPVIVVGLGWIGFLYGSHFEWRLMRRYPPALYGAAAAEALITFAVVSLLCGWLLFRLPVPERAAGERLAAALILGICASGTAPAGVFHLGSRASLRPDDTSTLRFLSTVDDLPALLLLGIMGAWLHSGSASASWLAPWLWLAASVALGVGLGLITHWLFPRESDVRRNSLVLLGVVALGAGAASILRLSPLFVTALAGFTFANISPRKESAYGLLAESEHALYTVFLLVAGLLFRFDWAPLWLLVPAYLLCRTAGKLGGGRAAVSLFLRGSGVSPRIGSGLLFQGGMALAMAIGFQRTHLAVLDSQVTTTIILGVVIFELLGPFVAAAALSRRRP